MDKKFERNIENTSNGQISGLFMPINTVNDYYIGLDIGTDSCGWAVTDSEYRLLKASGKPLWGSYLFDAANTAEKRRTFRTSRRRLARRHNRLMLLQELFADEIAKIDSTFFIRLNNSQLLAEDKDERIATKYILFGDTGYTDKEYFKQYPTIFHLRKALMIDPPEDIRLLYLACHHIIKNRGHFLFEDKDFDFGGSSVIKGAFENINVWFDEHANDNDFISAFELNDDKIAQAAEILKGKKPKSDKQRELIGLFCVDKKNKCAVSILKAVTGGTCKACDFYGAENDADDYRIDFSTMDDEKFEAIKSAFDDGCLLNSAKSIYDWSVLVGILKDSDAISSARVASYDVHKADLKLLKQYVKTHCPQKYKLIFCHQTGKDYANNYAAYIGMDKHKSYSKTSRDEFYAFLEKAVFNDGKVGFFKYIDEICEKDSDSIKARYENKEFLPKQITSNNGVIPYQLHLKELKVILEKAQARFEFLNKKDDDGLTIAQKIISLMTFRIPYYVGPLGGGPHSWAVRANGTEHTKITPWNFDKIIDKDASEDKFIKNMTGKCSYIPTADVLPASSLLYSEVIFLNELNNLKINGEKDSRAIDLIYEYAHTHKKVTQNGILGVLKRNGYDKDLDKNSLSGIDGDMKTSLASYIDFYNIIGKRVDSERAMCEDIIVWLTLMSDKDRVVRRIKQNYGNKLADDEIKKIKGLNYSKWGKLSAQLLSEILSEKAFGRSGEPLSVVQTMLEYKINLSEALKDPRYGFTDAIDCYNRTEHNDKESSIDDLYCSPSVKRSIRRSVALVKEIVKIVGHEPKKIMVEMARGGNEEQKNKRTVSRKQQLLDLYKKCKEDVCEFTDKIEKREERDFASKRLFLYYMQKGRCMYSGEKIDINELFSANVYDIDHIYPQAKVNDDGFDNRVLVKREINARKSDIYPLPADIRARMLPFWTELNNQGFLSDKKFGRLKRSIELTANELAEFENRQIVITQQSTKVVASILKSMFKNSEIVYSKASKTAEFKNKFNEYAEKSGCGEEYSIKLVKVRELNNLHHAKDAYINIVVGNVLNTEYGHDARVFYKNKTASEMRSDYKLFQVGVKNAWDPKRDIPTAAKTYYTDNCRVVRFVSEGTGKLFEAAKTAGANDNLIPLKKNGKISDTGKYGGYDSARTGHFMLVKSKGKKGEIRLTLEAIPILIDLQSKAHPEILSEYLSEKCALDDPQVVIEKIRLNTLFLIDGSPAYIRGKTENRIIWCNAAEIYMDRNNTEYFKKVAAFNKKYLEAKKFKRGLLVDEVYDGINSDDNVALYDVLTEKLGGKMFKGLPPIFGQKVALEECRNQFIHMSLEMQCVVLNKISAFLNSNSVHLDLSDFVDNFGKPRGKNCGDCKIGKFVENVDIKMINQSPTGQYRKVIDLKNFLN